VSFACIDIGSNTVRMLIADRYGSEKIYFRRVTRLAGNFSSGVLAPQSMQRTLSALVDFRQKLDLSGVKKIWAVGTAALRAAENAAEFLALAHAQAGFTIDIIDGEREAHLSSKGILGVLDPVPERSLLFDIGGGSTEFVLYDGDISGTVSLELGVVRLLESYPDKALRQKRITQELEAFFAAETWQEWLLLSPDFTLVGTAGTVTTLAALALALEPYEGSRVNNLVLDIDWLENLEQKLLKLTPSARLKLAGMEEGREEIILPGIELLKVLLGQTGKKSFRVSDAGILEGLLLEAMREAV